MKLPLRIILIAVGCLVFTSADARKIPGYIVNHDGTRKEVIFNIRFGLFSSRPSLEGIQNRIVYFDNQGNRVVLFPDEVREIAFKIKNEEIRMLSVPNTLEYSLFSKRTNIFLHLKVDGKLRLFKYYYTQQTPGYYSGTGGMSVGHTYSTDSDVLQLGEGELMQPRGLNFRKDMLQYLSGCEEVTSLIESRDLKRNDIETIVMLYNDKCS